MRIKKEVVRESFTTRINPKILSELKHLAVDLKKPLSHLIEESILYLLKKYSKK